MANSNPAEPVSGVSAVKGAKDLYALHQDAVKQEESWEKLMHTKDAVRMFSCFLMVIEIVNHIGLDKVDSAVIGESDLMDIEHQMQECMTDITKFINELQSKVKGFNLFTTGTRFAPDTFLGLESNYYNIDQTGHENISSSPDGTSPNDFQQSLQKFEAAFKKLFFANGDSDTSSPKLKDLSTIQNPNVFQKGKDFDLTGYWSDMKSAYDKVNFNKGPNGLMVTNNAEDRPSLIQRWMYYKALTTVNGSSAETVDNANGDIGKLVDFAPNGTKASSFLLNFFTFFGQMDITVAAGQVNRDGYSGSVVNTTTEKSLVQLIIDGNEGIYSDANGLEPGLFAAFNYEAYNSFWSKTNAIKSVSSDVPPNAGTEVAVADGDHSHTSDDLPTFLSSANMVQTAIGTETSSASTDMQQMTANEGDFVDVGQGMIKSLNQYGATMSANQLSA